MLIAMIDSQGRIIIPQDILDKLEVQPGDLLEFDITQIEDGFEVSLKKAKVKIHTGK